MSIKITGQTTGQIGGSQERGGVHSTPERGSDAKGTELSRPTTDTVHLTGRGALLQRLEGRVAAAPVVDEARVEQIRTALAEGRFQMDPQRVAEKMMDLELAIART